MNIVGNNIAPMLYIIFNYEIDIVISSKFRHWICNDAIQLIGYRRVIDPHENVRHNLFLIITILFHSLWTAVSKIVIHINLTFGYIIISRISSWYKTKFEGRQACNWPSLTLVLQNILNINTKLFLKLYSTHKKN